jgi:Lon protease-like protein
MSVIINRIKSIRLESICIEYLNILTRDHLKVTFIFYLDLNLEQRRNEFIANKRNIYMKPCYEAPLFPLSAHLLPGGRMSLRIFEPRYVRMIKEVCAADTGFGVCMVDSQGNKNKNEHIYPIGTFCKVTDFDLLDDGFLGVTVEGQTCFKINSITTQPDELRIGECENIDTWSSESASLPISPMDDKLKEIFENYPELKAMYQTPQFNDPIWVIYRWLELLPVDASQKQEFLKHKDCTKALEYLAQLVE